MYFLSAVSDQFRNSIDNKIYLASRNSPAISMMVRDRFSTHSVYLDPFFFSAAFLSLVFAHRSRILCESRKSLGWVYHLANGRYTDGQDGCRRSRSRSRSEWFGRQPEVNTGGAHGNVCAYRIPVYLFNVGLLSVYRFKFGHIAYVISVSLTCGRPSDASFIANSIDLSTLTFPTEMLVDYVRVYQRKDSTNVGCNPLEYPTTDYISRHQEAYTSAFCPRRGAILHNNCIFFTQILSCKSGRLDHLVQTTPSLRIAWCAFCLSPALYFRDIILERIVQWRLLVNRTFTARIQPHLYFTRTLAHLRIDNTLGPLFRDK